MIMFCQKQHAKDGFDGSVRNEECGQLTDKFEDAELQIILDKEMCSEVIHCYST